MTIDQHGNQCLVSAPNRSVLCTRAYIHVNDPEQMCCNASVNLSWCPRCDSLTCEHMNAYRARKAADVG